MDDTLLKICLCNKTQFFLWNDKKVIILKNKKLISFGDRWVHSQ